MRAADRRDAGYVRLGGACNGHSSVVRCALRPCPAGHVVRERVPLACVCFWLKCEPLCTDTLCGVKSGRTPAWERVCACCVCAFSSSLPAPARVPSRGLRYSCGSSLLGSLPKGACQLTIAIITLLLEYSTFLCVDRGLSIASVATTSFIPYDSQ